MKSLSLQPAVVNAAKTPAWVGRGEGKKKGALGVQGGWGTKTLLSPHYQTDIRDTGPFPPTRLAVNWPNLGQNPRVSKLGVGVGWWSGVLEPPSLLLRHPFPQWRSPMLHFWDSNSRCPASCVWLQRGGDARKPPSLRIMTLITVTIHQFLQSLRYASHMLSALHALSQ